MQIQIFVLALLAFLTSLPCLAASTAPIEAWEPTYTADQLIQKEMTEAPKREAWDHAHYVRPAPPDFKPESNPHKLKLVLIPERTMAPAGKVFRYRAELQNVGNQPAHFFEMVSFFKVGTAALRSEHGEPEKYSGFDFLVTGPDGKTKAVERLEVRDDGPGGGEFQLPGANKMTPSEQEEAIKELNYQAAHESELSVTLNPGESIVSKSYHDRDFGTFRDLTANVDLKKPGTYRFQLVYVQLPPESPQEDRKYYSDKARRLRENGEQRDPSYKRYLSKAKRKITQHELDFYHERLKSTWGRIESNVVEVEVSS